MKICDVATMHVHGDLTVDSEQQWRSILTAARRPCVSQTEWNIQFNIAVAMIVSSSFCNAAAAVSFTTASPNDLLHVDRRRLQCVISEFWVGKHAAPMRVWRVWYCYISSSKSRSEHREIGKENHCDYCDAFERLTVAVTTLSHKDVCSDLCAILRLL